MFFWSGLFQVALFKSHCNRKRRLNRGFKFCFLLLIALKCLTEKFSRLTISSGVLLTVKGSVGRIRDSFFTGKFNNI